ncbi:hypothetical protein HFX_5258 (plasmid) [Haloferax mediterranei ATCC 33500]|uniref:Uncharacterized protein n=1 Tax=Haloferax mediterranei (strain ATCC 33500 / DSM 1411 / JCM 8866 / NBRC 14739 / NCIMB 2177 / R-4) TaxID=523841 RepID=I3RA30_HALMT|nr:hypothetical protein HFX_5258 [Haloferax mediterranei ATCC 33500]
MYRSSLSFSHLVVPSTRRSTPNTASPKAAQNKTETELPKLPEPPEQTPRRGAGYVSNESEHDGEQSAEFVALLILSPPILSLVPELR